MLRTGHSTPKLHVHGISFLESYWLLFLIFSLTKLYFVAYNFEYTYYLFIFEYISKVKTLL